MLSQQIHKKCNHDAGTASSSFSVLSPKISLNFD